MHPARMHELDVPDDWLEGGRFDGRPQLRSRGRSRRSGSRSKVRTDAGARSPSRSKRMATPVRVKKEKSPTSEPQDQKRDNEQPQHRRRHRRKQRSPSPPVDHKPLGGPDDKGPDPSGGGFGMFGGGTTSLLIHIGQALAAERGIGSC